MRSPELVIHVQALLRDGHQEAAGLHLLAAARGARSRAEGGALRGLVGEVPRALWTAPGWPLTLAWVAYRSADFELLRQVLGRAAPDALLAFRACLACAEGRWADAEAQAAQALNTGAPTPETGVALRHAALAAYRLGRPGWRPAFERALQGLTGRDRGVSRIEYAVALSTAGHDAAARPEFAQATREVRGDAFMAVYAQSNLGITCLRLGELRAAEDALREALDTAGRAGGGPMLPIHLGLGGIYRLHREFPRAAEAFVQAERVATTPGDRAQAMIGRARVLMQWGRLDHALSILLEAAAGVGVRDGAETADTSRAGTHRIMLDISLARLLMGDGTGARAALERTGVLEDDEARLKTVLQAELSRRAGHPERARAALTDLGGRPSWRVETARLLPEVFALAGFTAPAALPWTVTVTADGPVRVSMHGSPLPLKPSRPEAALLALLIYHGPAISRERALEDLQLPGPTPDARRKELSRAVRRLREVLGWPGAVQVQGGMITLSAAPQWQPLVCPAAERADLFCEGRYDPWILEWRQNH